MKSKENKQSIVSGGGWHNEKEIYVTRGFTYFLMIELIIVMISIVLALLYFLETKVSEDSLFLTALITFLYISQPIMIILLIKSYGKKTVKKKVKSLYSGQRETDPNNLY